MSRVTALSGRLLIGAAAALLIVLSAPQQCSAQGQPAVVEGTSQLFIRRGPGREFPPFATLTGGSKVRVQERHGAWARVTTASGQVGYVHNKFLRVLDADPEAAATAESPSTAVPPTAGAPPTRTPAATATRRRREAEATAAHPQASPTAEATQSPSLMPTNTRTAAAPVRSGNPQREIERLSEAVEALNRRLDQRFPLPDDVTQSVTDAGTGVSGGAILLGLIGTVLGWLLGATYQRNKERGRRSRIRL